MTSAVAAEKGYEVKEFAKICPDTYYDATHCIHIPIN